MDTWVKVKNYKCFGDSPQGFEEITGLNVLIGRNNSGKSALLDVIAFLCKPTKLAALRPGPAPEVLRMGRVHDDDWNATFRDDSRDSIVGDHQTYGVPFRRRIVTWRISANGHNEFVSLDGGPQPANQFQRGLITSQKNPLLGKFFKRILADRDIRPEPSNRELKLGDDGSGATNVIQRFLNELERPTSLIEDRLREALNHIFEPDASFSRIRVQQLPNDEWEVVLDEENKGSIALTNSGSGLKTVILVLLFVIVMPFLDGKKLADYVFGFEELENNLHPALQRRLLLFLQDLVTREHVTLFLTTHSTVAIDYFSRDPGAQILHVRHDRTTSSVSRVSEYAHSRALLDDIEIRASDMLQANGIIWVEGPSDRIYVRRWIDLWAAGALKEGIHYQCMFYGGRLLKHLSCESPGTDPARIALLTMNRNVMILIDSDLKADGARLPATKLRMIEEVGRIDGLAWVTWGKEIENYIPVSVLEATLGISIGPLRRDQVLWRVLDRVKIGEGARLERDKIGFADRVVPSLTREALENTHDLGEKLDAATTCIRKWNGL